ncbi:MAG TPA: hypothetical protein VF939_28205 [Puia sp.]
MKNDVSKGSENRQPENTSVAGQDSFSPPAKSNFFLDGIAKIVQAVKPKRFVSYRKKKINKDGSSVETEFIYRDDR